MSTGTVSTPAYETYSIAETTLMSIIPQEEATVTIQVDELDVLSIQEGMFATVSLDAINGNSYTGIITEVDFEGTNSGGNTKYSVVITLPVEDGMLAGMTAAVRITTDVSEPVSTLPAAALQEVSGKTYVYTVYDEKHDTLSGLTEVTTGRSDGTNVEILTGLADGTAVYYRYADSIEYNFVG